MIIIDGSQGEGGGQVLRSSLSLSLVTGKPFRIQNIRARRKNPGLMRQHLMSVRAAAEVGKAELRGASLGSAIVTFEPQGVTAGDFAWSIGTAGSTTLVLQTVLPALLTAPGPSSIVLEGGTHNPMAPPFDFLERTFIPVLNRMGPRVAATLHRPGFYPAGGGRCEFRVEPVAALDPIELLERGPVRRVSARATVANLPKHIAERELHVLQRELDLEDGSLTVHEIPDARGPGNFVTVEIESADITEIVTGFGQRGVRAEQVARAVAGEARRYLDAGVPVGEHLADQLLLPMSLAGGGSFRTLPLSPHALTNIDVIRSFLDVVISVEADGDRACRVTVSSE